jgi:hypothetical protein
LSRRSAWAIAALLLAAAGGEELGANYDRLFAAHDYGTLAAALKKGMETSGTALPTLAWEQRRVAAGSSVFVSAQYALDLLAATRGGTDPARDVKTRESAVVLGLYTMAAIETDGMKCADPAAVVARRRQFAVILTPVWAELRKLPDESVAAALTQALVQEQAKAAARPPDDYLCRGRTADIPDVLAEGVAEQAPRFAAAATWAAKVDAARKVLPTLLSGFAAKLKSGT